MAEPLHLDIIIANSRFLEGYGDNYDIIDLVLGEDITQYAREMNFTYHLSATDENVLHLEEEKNLPQKSIILTHGGYCSDWIILSRIGQLSVLRPDLRFIVSIHDGASYGFCDETARRVYQELNSSEYSLEKSFWRTSRPDPKEFLAYTKSKGEEEDSQNRAFRGYLTHYLKWRKRNE